MKITGATDTEFPDGERLPFASGHRLKAADGSVIIGENYVDETVEMFIVSGYRNSVGAGCHNISILNSSGCIIVPGISHANIVNSSGVIVQADNAVVINSSGVTVSERETTIINNITQASSTSASNVKKIKYTRLTQVSTNAPTASVFENTLSGTPVMSRAGSGDYLFTLNNAFVNQEKVFFFFVNGQLPAGNQPVPYWNDANSVGLSCNSDDVILEANFEIQVRP